MNHDDKMTELMLSVAQLTSHIKAIVPDSTIRMMVDALREEVVQLVETAYDRIEEQEKAISNVSRTLSNLLSERRSIHEEEKISYVLGDAFRS